MTNPAPYPPVDGQQPCASEDPETFFPTSREAYWKTPRAKAACGRCHIRRECLAHALTWDVVGIWGGTTKLEREALRREHGIQAAAAVLPESAQTQQEVERLTAAGYSASEVATRTGLSLAAVSQRLAPSRNAHRTTEETA